MVDQEKNVTEISKQFFSFGLEDETFAIDVLNVKEVLEYRSTRIARVPKTLPYIKGIVNLRGNVIPVIDLRKRFALDEKITIDTSIIVVEIKIEKEKIIAGIIVDTVKEVINLSESDIELTNKIGLKQESEYVKKIAKYNNKQFIVILDIEKIFLDIID